MTKALTQKFPSELRYNLVDEDWVVIATGRAKRPETFKKEKRFQEEVSPASCPFCHIETQEIPTLIFNRGRKIEPGTKGKIPSWTTIVIPNKYPAFVPGQRLNRTREGKFYLRTNAIGFHEVVVTRDHKKPMAQFSSSRIKEVIDVYQSRFLALKEKKFVNHIAIFHNHGREAGASIAHPHSQIITTPMIDGDLKRALWNSRNYYQKEGSCSYCEMGQWERRVKKRIVFENSHFLALCPFASKVAFEVIISPKRHLAYFEKITEHEKIALAETFQAALSKLYKGLNNPAYNFYLHTAPPDKKNYDYYHWHWTILPKTSRPAGFEMGSQMEISTIEPERAAEYLRRQ